MHKSFGLDVSYTVFLICTYSHLLVSLTFLRSGKRGSVELQHPIGSNLILTKDLPTVVLDCAHTTNDERSVSNDINPTKTRFSVQL